MNKGIQAEFRFDSYLISKSLIEIKDRSERVDKDLSVSFSPSGVVSKDMLNVELDVNLTNENKSLLVNLSMNGIFVFKEDLKIDILNGAFCSNAIAIMFPYIRAYISTLASLSGIGSLMLPTLALTNLGDVLKDNLREE